MGYNLKRDGCLNSFVDAKNQSIREDGVPRRGAREKGPNSFSILFSALTDKEDNVMDWQCGVGMVFILLILILILFSNFNVFFFHVTVSLVSSPLRIWLY